MQHAQPAGIQVGEDLADHKVLQAMTFERSAVGALCMQSFAGFRYQITKRTTIIAYRACEVLFEEARQFERRDPKLMGSIESGKSL